MLEKLLDAVNWSPPFERFVTAGLPTDELWSDLQTRFQIERGRGPVLKDNFDDAVIGVIGKLGRAKRHPTLT
jgi:hypothetical protein